MAQTYVRKWMRYWRVFATAFLLLILLKLVFLPRVNIDCYRLKGETLPNISEVVPRKGKSIFFHETSCKSSAKGKITITARQACAVESAAKMNPNLDVYLLFTSPGVFKFEEEESDQILQALLSYENINIKHLDYETYTNGTPVEELYSSGKIEGSRYVVSHASDVLRYLTLWKYGGIYLDLDVIVLKSFEDLSPNFAGLESTQTVAAGVLSFDGIGKGHLLAERCLYALRDGFNGYSWGDNGPGIITRLLKQLCGVASTDRSINLIEKMVDRDCGNFTVFPPLVFYPIAYEAWYWYFDETKLTSLIFNTRNSYTLHMWNKLSENTKISLKSNAPYLYFARKYCPKVIEACLEEF